MSAPMQLTPKQMGDLKGALFVLTEMRKDHGVVIGDASGIMSIRHEAAGVSLEIAWSEEDQTFIIDDRVGS